jgi:hypothetical protein
VETEVELKEGRGAVGCYPQSQVAITVEEEVAVAAAEAVVALEEEARAERPAAVQVLQVRPILEEAEVGAPRREGLALLL